MEEDDARRLLARAPLVHLASINDAGLPLLRAVHTVSLEDNLLFHGAPAGEKQEALGRPVVAQAEEIIAEIPSYFLDPERACPATTYYRSAQVHAVLEEVQDLDLKAATLQALMDKYQPQGGYTRIVAPGAAGVDPSYRKAVAGVQVLRLSLRGPTARVEGKAKLGQNRGPADRRRVLQALWARGLPGDARAIDLVAQQLQAEHGAQALPELLRGPQGTTLACAVGDEPGDEDAMVDLLRDAYWNEGVQEAKLRRSHRASSAWVGARDASGALCATARALSDNGKYAAVYDVMVAPAYRGCGLGQALLRLLLDHPAVRGATKLWLRTRDADPFYRRFGFVPLDELPARPYRSIEMWLQR